MRVHATGGYTIAELMEVFSIGCATVYRVLDRVPNGSESDKQPVLP